MAEIVSLNQYRKAKKRKMAARTAAGNRLRHGRKGHEEARDDAERERRSGEHEGTRLERRDSPPDTD